MSIEPRPRNSRNPRNHPRKPRYQTCTTSFGKQRKPAWLVALLPAMLVLMLCLSLLAANRPWLLYNRTPSVPLGFYRYAGQTPARGDLIAFSLPGAAHEYARHRGESTDILLLKPVLANRGDHVSTLHGELRINGVLIGAIPDTDAAGRALPHWRGDRVLTDTELFVGSTPAEHSFDSRFFGPIDTSQVVGVYRRFRQETHREDDSEPEWDRKRGGRGETEKKQSVGEDQSDRRAR